MYTWIEIDSKAIKHNLKEFKKISGTNQLIMPVIKANAYGHGLLEIAKICNKSNLVDRICVVNDDEAIKLIEHKIKKPLMIIGFFDVKFKKTLKLAKKNVIFPVYSLKQAKFLNRVGESINKRIKINIKIDIGTSRLGFLPNQINDIKIISQLKKINIDGIYGHFASSESDARYTNTQLKLFNKITTELIKNGIEPKIKHIGCSAAFILFKNTRLNGARIGLGLYGLYSSKKMQRKIKLKPALSMYTKIIQIKKIIKGANIGYGRTYLAKKNIDLAILPVGYWDGYDRRLSNNSYVLIDGNKCPVRGNICMNLTMVELPKKHKNKVGDRVVLIGRQNKELISVDSLATKCKTINYEFVDRLNPELPRIVI